MMTVCYCEVMKSELQIQLGLEDNSGVIFLISQ